MSRPIKNYKITPAAQKRFKRWLFEHDLSFSEFARRCGTTRQYLDNAIKGKITITPTVIEWFKKGGYDLI